METADRRLTASEEVALGDGRTQVTFCGGGTGIYPPLPGSAWQERVSAEMSAINYRIMRRMEDAKLS